MKSTLTLGISLILASQSIHAIPKSSQDRTSGIASQQLQNAQANLLALRNEIVKMDQALAQLEVEIVNRESKGHWLNGISVVGAGLGLGLSAMATFMFKSRGGSGSGISGAIYGAASILLSVGSLASGTTRSALQDKFNPQDADLALATSQKQIDQQINSTSEKSTKSLLIQLSEGIKASRLSLQEYTQSENSDSRNKFLAQVAQAAGVALTVFGTTQRQSPLVGIGVVVMTAGNIGQIIGTLSEGDADVLLKEIEATRRSLQVTIKTLE